MDRGVIENVLKHTLKMRPKEEDASRRRIAEILGEEWDLFLRVFADGLIVLTAVAVSNLCLLVQLSQRRDLEYRSQASDVA
jgi:hypothetical protein